MCRGDTVINEKMCFAALASPIVVRSRCSSSLSKVIISDGWRHAPRRVNIIRNPILSVTPRSIRAFFFLSSPAAATVKGKVGQAKQETYSRVCVKFLSHHCPSTFPDEDLTESEAHTHAHTHTHIHMHKHTHTLPCTRTNTHSHTDSDINSDINPHRLKTQITHQLRTEMSRTVIISLICDKNRYFIHSTPS